MRLRAALFILLLVPAAARCLQNPAPSAEPSSRPAAQTAPSEAPELTLDEAIRLSMAVMITVGATVLALFPLAAHGGPLWQPLTYAQIGGLCVATFITLQLVPVLYTIFVVDLKIVKWEGRIWADDSAPAGAPDSADGN